MTNIDTQFICDNGHIHTRNELVVRSEIDFHQLECPDCFDVMFNDSTGEQFCKEVLNS